MGPAAKLGEELARLALELVVGDHAIDQAPFERLRGGDPLAEHRHLRRPGGARAGRTTAVTPPSGTRPMLTKARRKKADSAATIRSQASASEQPIPAAGPLTAAITGFGISRTERMIGL